MNQLKDELVNFVEEVYPDFVIPDLSSPSEMTELLKVLRKGNSPNGIKSVALPTFKSTGNRDTSQESVISSAAPNHDLQAELQGRRLQLKTARDQLDDCSILVRMCMDQILIYHKSISQLISSIFPSESKPFDVDFKTAIDIELCTHDDLHLFLRKMGEFIMEAYDKVLKSSQGLNPLEYANKIVSKHEDLAIEFHHMVDRVHSRVAISGYLSLTQLQSRRSCAIFTYCTTRCLDYL